MFRPLPAVSAAPEVWAILVSRPPLQLVFLTEPHWKQAGGHGWAGPGGQPRRASSQHALSPRWLSAALLQRARLP